MKSVQGGRQLTKQQKWTRDNFYFLMDYIMCHLKGKSDLRAPKGSASQASAAAGSASRRETVHMELFQDTSRPESRNDPADMSHLETHMSTARSCDGSMISSLADSNFQSALVVSQRGITKLKDIVAKKLTDDKANSPSLGFCDFLKVEVVQLTIDLYDEFQQETFNLLMGLKQSDKQQRCHLGMGTRSTPYSHPSNHYPLSHTQMQAPQEQMPQTFTQVPQGQPQQKHLHHSQQHFQQTFTQPHAPAQHQFLSVPSEQPIQQQQQQPIQQTVSGSEQKHMQQGSQQATQQ